MRREVHLAHENSLHAPKGALPAPPGTWAPAHTLARKALAPVERFLAVEAASGVVLLVTAIVALVWANSPWRHLYERLWHTPFGLRLGPWAFERDLHFWINDGLMTVFFFVVGLEIRREMHCGELSDRRRAMLPVAAALGGMAMPAALFLAFNHGRASAVGWGVPMATDIAFAVGVLALLGRRVAPALRILLLALAVIDDVGAIIVIAVFYSSSFSAIGFVVVGLGVAATLGMQKVGVRSPWAYAVPATVIWAGAYFAGIHPTLAGVIVGLMTPVRAWYGAERFLDVAETSVQSLRANDVHDEQALFPHLDAIGVARREAVSPVEALQHALHGSVAFGIMPLFALANAGVPLGQATFQGDGLRVFLGVTVGLVLGKPIGVLGLSWVASRAGLTALPTGVKWSKVGVVGLCAGIGFTMALFIAQLAFPPGPLLETAKLGILCASAIAAVTALLVGLKVLRSTSEAGVASSEAEAEASTTA
jgi:NhaA family Na+:H+ antiporter